MFEVSPEDERDDIISQLTDAEDWIYMDGEDSDATGFRAKLKGLKDKTDPIFQRLAEKSLRPEAVEKAKSSISLYQSVMKKTFLEDLFLEYDDDDPLPFEALFR